MNKFGFSIHKSSIIDLDKVDSDPFNEIVKKERDILKCIACGTCSSTCTAADFTEVSFRKMVLFLERGLVSESKEMAKKCMICGKCYMMCPRSINTRKIIKEIINLKIKS